MSERSAQREEAGERALRERDPLLQLSLDVADLRSAIAEEKALRDVDLDQIEASLHRTDDPDRAAALALALGRAGRASSRAALERALSKHRAIALAIDLLDLDPLRTERTDHGYLFRDAAGALEVDDPIAAHWHALERWGPPIRPHPDARPVVAQASAELDALVGAAFEGSVILASFAPPLGAPVHPALRLCACGFARTPSFVDLVRWSEVASLGMLEDGRARAIAWERRDGFHEPLGHRPILGEERLLDLMGRLLIQSRS